ncbi:protein kinase family protein [Marmoricola sp. URHB0036]|uniref:protein kinase family protein n=1 Tax=Marmoricola sp. URHB0036 TaxID=1298863 RepID=UPI000483BC99|nr:protein kinase family protein [Marmoricola sp. URHB0036]
MSNSIGPGTVLAGRYRLDDLLTESEGARFWRATDTILARSVAVHAVPSDDERAPGLLDAARVSATVTDPHLLRVLDCDDAGGITWVVNEWGDGVSLDLMLQQGTLPPSRAAWLTREVADAIAAGHAQGVAHGRLNPEAVLVTQAGAVKLIGYVVDASLQRGRPPDPLYGELDEREADVINLAGVLYAGLTGRWPGVAPSAVPKAPREGRRPLRPRQVRAGVPRTLDVICERVLHKEASQHAMPIETAQEIAAALADFLGDSGSAAPLDLAGMHSEPTVSIHRDALATGVADLHAEALAAGTSSTDEAAEATVQSAPPAAEEPDPEDTQIYQEARQGPDSMTPLQAPPEAATPPPPFEDIPERPLFASTERRVPAAAQAAQAAEAARAAELGHSPAGATATAARAGVDSTSGGTGDTGSGFWPFTDEDEAKNDVHTGKEGRGWMRMAIVVGILIIVVVAMAIAFNRGRQDGGPTSGSPGSTPSQAAGTTGGAAVTFAGVRDFDPDGDPPEENPDTAKNAIDGDPSTSWTTVTYRGTPALGGLKPGVGLMLDLGKEQRVSSLTVRFKGAPTSYDVYAAPAGVTEAPDTVDQLDKVGGQQSAPEKSSITLESKPSTRYLLVWLTRLPQVAGGYRGEIIDITARS